MKALYCRLTSMNRPADINQVSGSSGIQRLTKQNNLGRGILQNFFHPFPSISPFEDISKFSSNIRNTRTRTHTKYVYIYIYIHQISRVPGILGVLGNSGYQGQDAIFGAVYAHKGHTKKIQRHDLHGFALDQPSIHGIGPINRSEKWKRSETVRNIWKQSET